MLVGRVALRPARSVARVPGVHISSRPDAADLDDGRGEPDVGDLAADERDHVLLLAAAARAASIRAWAPPRQMWVMASASASAASAGFGGRVEPQDPGHHRADLGLVGAAAAGDRGLDLARGVGRDRQAAPGGARPGRSRWPGRCP